MKTLSLLAVLLLNLAFAPLAAGQGDTVTVTLQVNVGAAVVPPHRDCAVTVPAGSNVGDVLDQAEADGCILEWNYAEFEGFGRYVTSIDHVTEAVVTFWAFRVDGKFAGAGIDDTIAQNGVTYLFTYEEWPVPTTGLL